MSDIAQHLPEQSKVVEAIYAAYKKAGDLEPIRGYLGASIIGHPCERYLWYYFRQCCTPDVSGRIYRLFETGDLEESRFVKNLRDIGCEVYDMQEPPTGGWPGAEKTFEMRQFEVSALGGHFSGHLDAAILGLPEAPKAWHVGEFKTHNAKSFKELLKRGVKESKPQHYAQMQVYMHLTGMKRALYLARNKDTDELYSERIRYDKTEAETLIERAERIISCTAPPTRISERRDFYQCGWCDAKTICRGSNSPDPAISLPILSCRQCCHATPILDSEGAKWKCEKHGLIGSNCKMVQCHDHLILPGLIAFAEPTDSGPDFIEFTNHDEFREFDESGVWRHGAGGFSSEELCKLPATLLTNETIQGVKDVFGAAVTDSQMDILARYPESDSRIVWKGPAGSLKEAWKVQFNDDLMALTPIKRNVDPFCSAIEFEGGRVAILWPDQTAEIRQGIE